MSVHKTIAAMEIGQTARIKYERNPTGKEIAAYKAARKLGRFVDVHQDHKNKTVNITRTK